MRSPEQLEKHLSQCANCRSSYMLLNYKSSFISSHPEIKNSSKFLPLSCNSYFCPSCSARRSKEISERFKKFSGKNTWRFLTLTLKNSYDNTETQLKQINGFYNNFMTTIRKSYPAVKYLRVLEIGKTGNVHCHVLLNVYIPQLRIKHLWKKASGAEIVDIRKATNIENAVLYLVKYLSKFRKNLEHNKLFYLLNVKRVCWSRNFERIIREKIFEAMPEFRSFTIDKVYDFMSHFCVFNASGFNLPDISCFSPPVQIALLNPEISIAKKPVYDWFHRGL